MPRVLFEKTGSAVWISHLDLMRVFQRAFKRGEIAIGYSQGYSPRAYVSIALPLSVGAESVCEILDFDLDESCAVPLEEIPARLNRTLPAGVVVHSVWDKGRKMKELTHLDVDVALEYDEGCPEGAAEALAAFFTEDHEILMDKRTKSGSMTKLDIRAMILSCKAEAISGQEIVLHARICAQNPSLNPMMLPDAVKTYLPHLAPSFAKAKRLEVLDAQGEVFR